MSGVIALDYKGRVVKTGDLVEIDEYEGESFIVVGIWVNKRDKKPMVRLTVAFDKTTFDYHAHEVKLI